MNSALILLYHDIGPGDPPLAISARLFEEHLDCLASCAATVMTVSELAGALATGRLPPRTICVTFDDGLASTCETAAPLLLDRGLRATVFCVAGHLGGTNDWPSQPAWVERRPLASAAQLAELSAGGIEIGAHGFDHEPLDGGSTEVLHREVVEAREQLQQEIGTRIATFAYPYGSLPSGEVRALVARTYDAACAVGARSVHARDDVFALPRVDAHYVRSPRLLRHVLSGRGGPYLALRTSLARGRRLVGVKNRHA